MNDGDPRLGWLGLRAGEEVRFLPYGGGRPAPALVARAERDGSVTVIDADGASRSLPVERIEVRFTGARGRKGWEPLAARAGRAEQLSLLDP